LSEEEQAELFASTRRGFIKRMIAAGFGVPMIGSFGFTELASASGRRSDQSFPNQTPPQTGNNGQGGHGDNTNCDNDRGDGGQSGHDDSGGQDDSGGHDDRRGHH